MLRRADATVESRVVIGTAEIGGPVVSSPAPSPGGGTLRISAGRRSRVTRAAASSPLRLLTPLNHGRAAWIYTSTLGGGLLDGDRIELSIEVDPRAAAVVSTQASTKIYRGSSSSRLFATVGDGGLLIVAPDPVVCFARSTYQQIQRFDLRGSAAVVVVDWFTAGRRAMGERWAFDRYATVAEISRDGRRVLYDALVLDARDGGIAARMGRFDVVCTIAIAGAQLERFAAGVLAEIAAMAVARRASAVVSASAIDGTGCIVRIAGGSVEAAGAIVRRLLLFLPPLLGDDPWTRRW
jgi:urease accessory protein